MTCGSASGEKQRHHHVQCETSLNRTILLMLKVQTLNQISPEGLDKFSGELYELGSDVRNPDAILVQSRYGLNKE